MTKYYKSDALAAVHQTMEDLSEIGLVESAVMKKFDDSCLVHSANSPAASSSATARESVPASIGTSAAGNLRNQVS